MNRLATHAFFFIAAIVCFTSCSKDVLPEGDNTNGSASSAANKNGNSKLVVKVTRSGDNEGTKISYPVNVYVFGATGACVATHTFEEGSKQKTINLVEGQYTVCALAGADAAHYALPDPTTVTKQSLVKLLTGASHGDLMLSHNDVSLVDGEKNELSLALKRQVMLIDKVQINNVPSSASKVEVVLAPLYDDIALDGSFARTNSSGTFALTKLDEQRTWETSAPVYLLPVCNQATITIRFTLADGTINSYSYTCDENVFVANKKFRIAGTYAEAIGVNLTCAISGDEWAGTEDIAFNFAGNDSSTTTPGTTDPVAPGAGGAPEIGTNYKGCYVLSSEVGTDGKTYVTLIGRKDLTGFIDTEFAQADADAQTKIKAIIDEKMPEMIADEQIKEGWHLPTVAEIKMLSKAGFGTVKQAIAAQGCGDNLDLRAYLTDDNKQVKLISLQTGTFNNNYKFDSSIHLRLFNTVTF